MQGPCISFGLWSELDFTSFLSNFSNANDLKLNDFIPQEFSSVNRTLLKSKFRIFPMIAVKASWISVSLELVS